MPKYVLGHHLKGEGARLELMSELLDPMHRRYMKPGARTLEVGCGNGSISAWLAKRVSPGGTAVAVDLDLSLINVRMPNLELRKADIVAGPVERGTFELVTARAVLHHVADAQAAIANMAVGLKPGVALLLIEPDFLPVSVAEPPEVRAFWDGWLMWSRERGIDYHIGRTLAPRLASLDLTNISGTAETAVYNVRFIVGGLLDRYYY
jgi:SAM-dependent methyltransferase